MAPRGFLTEEEKANGPKATTELIFRIFFYPKPYWLQFMPVFAAIVLSSVVGLLPCMITGRIAEEGTQDELLAQGGLYKQLYKTQFRRVIDHEQEQEAR